jgi:hypothetical protein
MNDITIGESIANSVDLIDKAGKEIDSLLNLIEEEVNRELLDRSFGLFPYVGTWQYSENFSDNQWVYKDVARSLELGERSNSKTKRYLSIQVSLSGEGIESSKSDNKEPLVHVCFWEIPVNFNEDIYFSLGEADAHLKNNVLWDWSPDASRWIEQEWTYSLRLTSINTIEDIRRKIVSPFIALTSNKTEKIKNIQGVLLHN